MRRTLAAILLTTGCGRLGFDPVASRGMDGGPTSDPDAVVSDATAGADALVWDGCTGPGVLICDDFEQGLGKWVVANEGGGTALVDTGLSHTGSHSLRVVSQTIGDRAFLELGGLGPLGAGQKLSARYYLHVTADDYTSIQITQFNTTPTDDHVGLDLVSGREPVGWIEGGQQQLSPLSSFQLPADQWLCLQIEVQLGDGDGSFKLWVDGQPRIESTNLVTPVGSGVDEFRIGIVWNPSIDGTIAANFDDVVLATGQSIPCRP